MEITDWSFGVIDELGGTHDLFQAKIGDELPPLEFKVTEEMVARSCFATNDYNPWYTEDSPFGRPIVPPAMFTPLEGIITWSYYARPLGGIVNSKEEIYLLNALKVVKKVKITAKLADRYPKRERECFVFEYLTVDEDGVEILRTRRARTTPAVLPRENLGPMRLLIELGR
ncbi:hypothetical protein ACFLWI_00695 [Chloroflexota bacterium]